jgi:hypothetical protein
MDALLCESDLPTDVQITDDENTLAFALKQQRGRRIHRP